MITPHPDPAPNTGSRPVTYAAYSYVTTGENRYTHKLIPGVWFRCEVPVYGRRICVEFRESEAAS